uniref:Uncharacterized protein n=1 Tax=Panagrolaimus davidi TaxID=227884 RepID=A0A914QW36_9BILA
MLEMKDSTKIPQTPPPCDFPSDVLKWMKKNTSNPRKSLKLMQICKYFQMESFKNYNHVCTVCEKYISKKDFIKHKIIDYKVEDFKDLPYKFWITHDLTSLSPDFNLSLLISKIAFCEAKKINVNSQKLLYDEFKILVGGNCVEILDFISTTLKYSKNGTDVSFEDFIGLLPKVKKIYL